MENNHNQLHNEYNLEKKETKIGVYPGSFDPLTYGHLDLIERGSRLFNFLYIVVSKNTSKKHLFTSIERKKMLERVTEPYHNVEVIISEQLIADFASQLGATSLLRGLRVVTDFVSELQMATANYRLNPHLDTVFMMTKAEYSFLSSSMVKEIASYNGDISQFVPAIVEQQLFEALKNR